MSPAAELRWVHPPRQERSQQTLERLLAAAECRIAEVGFEKATVADIVKRAESSVGAFYTRFKDKDALLRCLVARFVEEATATVDSALQPQLWAEASTEELCHTLVRFTQRVLHERRLFMSAVARSALDDAELAGFREVVTARSAERLLALLEARGAVVGHSDPISALRFATWTCVCLLEAGALQGTPGPDDMSAEQVVDEACSMILSYLRIRSRQPQGSHR